MDGFIQLLSWTPSFSGSGSLFDAHSLLIIAMCMIGASLITRLTKQETSLHYTVNFLVMIVGCAVFNSIAGNSLAVMQNELVASAVTANFGMTLAGFALLYGYRNSY